MIISRTPFRVSFFGGGTDYPAWYNHERGAVLSTTIDKYCYITCRWLPPFFPHKHRIVYSRIEAVREIDEIQHKAVRAILKHMKIERGIEIQAHSDLPARAGLGSSSSFVVSLLHSLHTLQDNSITQMELAHEAIHVEQRLLGENVGSQDQTAAAIGGVSRIDFAAGDAISSNRLVIPAGRCEELEQHLMLFFTGFSRSASEIAGEQIRNTSTNEPLLRNMLDMVDEGIDILASDRDIHDFGRLLDEAWGLKRRLSDRITNPEIDDMYARALRGGALGGKLLGAGGGGFFLLFVSPPKQQAVRAALPNLLHVPFRFEDQGSQIIVHQPDQEAGAPR